MAIGTTDPATEITGGWRSCAWPYPSRRYCFLRTGAPALAASEPSLTASAPRVGVFRAPLGK
jgi:hypothetical protein